MSYETLYQAMVLRSQQEADARAAARRAELRAAARPAATAGRRSGWAALHLPALPRRHRHALPAPERVRLVG